MLSTYLLVRTDNNGTLSTSNLYLVKSNISHGGVCTILCSAPNNPEWTQQIMKVKE